MGKLGVGVLMGGSGAKEGKEGKEMAKEVGKVKGKVKGLLKGLLVSELLPSLICVMCYRCAQYLARFVDLFLFFVSFFSCIIKHIFFIYYYPPSRSPLFPHFVECDKDLHPAHWAVASIVFLRYIVPSVTKGEDGKKEGKGEAVRRTGNKSQVFMGRFLMKVSFFFLSYCAF